MRPLTAAVLLSAAIAAVAVASAVAPARGEATGSPVERGRYLVTTGLCNDCHTPWKMGGAGPEPDMSRMLSGHPQDFEVSAAPALAEPWVAAFSATNTAWAGPWGVSFTANLTPDEETGLGGWTEEQFIETLRTGRHLGRGRALLPPMPVQWIGQMTDADLRAVFAYLRSIPAVKNRVPLPRPPATSR